MMGDAMNKLLGTPGPASLPPDVMRSGPLSPEAQQFVSGGVEKPMFDPIADTLSGLSSTHMGRAAIANAVLDKPAGLSMRMINWTAEAPPAFVEQFQKKLPQVVETVADVLPREVEATKQLLVKGPHPYFGASFNTATRDVDLYAQSKLMNPNDLVGSLTHEAVHAGQQATIDEIGRQAFIDKMVPRRVWDKMGTQALTAHSGDLLRGIGYTTKDLANLKMPWPVTVAQEGQAYLAPVEHFGLTRVATIPAVQRLINFYRSMILGTP